MEMSESLGKQLSLISFASKSATLQLSQDLSSIGIQSDVCDGESWLKTPACKGIGGSEPLVCLIDETTNAGSVSAPLLDRLNGRPWLCASRAGNQAKIGRLLRASTEFIQSPWTRRELVLRLERLRSMAAFGPRRTPAVADLASLDIIGQARSFRATLMGIRKAARFKASVLIHGETGTGKELAARAIHYLSDRKGKPFVPVNCGAIPDTLIENELFGHEKGAFTDARSAQQGLASQADGGTLFFDEVESLSLKSQVTLLRFLQQFEIRPLGAALPRKVDVRILAATNAPIAKLVESGQFRSDLFFRLNVVELQLPALRDRRGDIDVLAEHFVEKYARTYQLRGLSLDRDALDWLRLQPWPGNVRELENVIHRGVIEAEAGCICLSHLLQNGHEPASAGDAGQAGADTFQTAKKSVIADFERRYLMRLLNEADGNVTLAAKRAGTERRALGKLLKKHDIDRRRFRAPSADAGPAGSDAGADTDGRSADTGR
jgi:DNA-binding NtrC family response regulator